MGTVHGLFETQVDLRPKFPAIVCGEETLSYQELDHRANQLARYLRLHGAGPGKFVGIYFERSEKPIIAILACLKSGAAYVPIDPAYPQERIRDILIESDTIILLTEKSLLSKSRECFEKKVIAVDWEAEIAFQSQEKLPSFETGVLPSDLCYVIYTSGTTGRPKGIMTAHHNLVRFVQAFNLVCATTPEDRVFQGFSLTFDGSVEEIWMAFSNGSTLVVPTHETPRFGNELGEYLAQNGVSYFSTVPTLLATITDPVPSLKLVVVSGEICPAELVSRWAGTRMLNVYGPTEATVNTTAFECIAGKPVTIGKPLEGYGIHILDEKMEPVEKGAKGELFVSGETLARGYLKQPELSAEKFFSVRGLRLYRTGDLVRWNEEGDLEFFGRIDSQVKIRGYRVELAEIESLLLENPNIRTATVKLFERGGLQELAAYVLLENSEKSLDRENLLSCLESRLPPYMVPGYLEILSEFPRLTSGKTDRARLPEPKSPLIRAATQMIAPETLLEKQVAAVWAKIFGLPEVSVEDDFFLQLGGHSLVAAQMVTLLRKETGRHVTVRDAYNHPTVRKLSAQLQSLPDLVSDEQENTHQGAQEVFESVPRATRYLTAILQLVSMYLLYGIASIPFVILLLPVFSWLFGDTSFTAVVWVWLGTIFFTWPVMLAVSIASKWMIIGRYKPGKYPLWGFQHFRFWLAGRFQAFSGAGALVGTPLLSVYFRAMGAKVGKNCDLNTATLGCWDLVSIGDETSIGADTQLLGYRVENGYITFGQVHVGSRCFIGNHSALDLNTRMEDDSRLDDQSMLPEGHVIASGEGKRGSPAQAADVFVPEGSPLKRNPFWLATAQLLIIHFLPLVALIPLIPFLALWYFAFADWGILPGILALIVSVPAGVVVTCFFIAALKKAVLSKAQPGTYEIDSVFYLRKWISDGIMKASRAVLLPLYTTLYFPPWLRLLGAKIGPRAELSTVWNFAPELVDVGEESFFADGSIIGGKRIFRGRFEIDFNRIGRRSFVGNSAILPVGKSLGDSCLLGVNSIPPEAMKSTPNGSEWLGSPAFALPNRPKVGNFSAAETFKPTRKLYIQRAIIDACRILIPGYVGLSAAAAGSIALYYAYAAWGVWAMCAISPVVAFGLAIYGALFVVALKKVVMGTFKPVIVPLWSMYVWLNEMVNGSYESIMSPAIAPFLGTPFIAPFLRLIGCKIGKHTYIETTLFSEWDLVSIGDYAALNAGAIIQNHLFEDRIMKSSYLKVGAECSVGNMAVVLYDSEMQRGATLGPLSLLMKGETLAPRTAWHGIPTVRAAGSPSATKIWAIPVGIRTEIISEPLPEYLPEVVAMQEMAFAEAE
jgi:non-ribosomal peptide synthetase-like protein